MPVCVMLASIQQYSYVKALVTRFAKRGLKVTYENGVLTRLNESI